MYRKLTLCDTYISLMNKTVGTNFRAVSWQRKHIQSVMSI